MVTSSIITGMMQISENWQGKSSALHFNDFGFHKTFFAVLSNGVLLRQTFLFFERKKSLRAKFAEKLRQLHHFDDYASPKDWLFLCSISGFFY